MLCLQKLSAGLTVWRGDIQPVPRKEREMLSVWEPRIPTRLNVVPLRVGLDRDSAEISQGFVYGVVDPQRATKARFSHR